ncbi:hypothetical protein HDU91_000381 [Kappamyces sp. JEL0680]|nr:hypothetical protein HDU91_000381 [Kappamyces sp. JEL0680]
MSISFRVAETGDAATVVSLVNGAYRGEGALQGWTTESELLDGQRLDEAMFQELLRKEHCDVLLFFREKDGAVACVNVELSDASACYIGMLSVQPQLQRSGLGKFVLETAEKHAQQKWHCSKAKMTVISKRTTLIAFYERRGYRFTGKVVPFPYGDDRFGIPKVPDLVFNEYLKDFGS